MKMLAPLLCKSPKQDPLLRRFLICTSQLKTNLLQWEIKRHIQHIQKSKADFQCYYFPINFGDFQWHFLTKKKAGWWLGHPSEKYEFVNWDEDRFPILMGQFKKWQPVTTNQKWFPEISSRGPSRIKHRPIQKLRTRRAAGNSFSEASRTCFLFRFWGPGRHGRMSREPGVLGN